VQILENPYFPSFARNLANNVELSMSKLVVWQNLN